MAAKISGDTASVLPGVIAALKDLAKFLDKEIIVTSGYRVGDSGAHGQGLAVDIVVPGVELLDLYLAAERFSFSGIGVYPSWQYLLKPIGGLHLDRRADGPARWMGLGKDKTQQYVALTKQNLELYGVI